MNTEAMIKRTVKDSVFTALFRDLKYLKELCKVLNPDVTEEELNSINIVTIQNVLVDDLYNDLGFKIGNRFLFLLEAQSTWTDNMVIRCPLYYFKTLQEVIDMMDTLFNEELILQAAFADKEREAKEEGIQQGRQQTILDTIYNIMGSLNLSAEKALTVMGVPQNEWNSYIPLLR